VLWIGIVLIPIRIRDPNFLVDTDPDPDWHQNDADPHADPNLSFTHVGKYEFLTFSHSLAISQFYLLICLKDVIILSILDSILKLWKNSSSTFSYAWH
jgi:hypothetical protein